ncbi:MAG: UvrD-helicase domain-containing protein, partial [Deltaproteobacteria bacterium]|nr:UvrD-helicase domain-containing protein [Deltaproteobacteria bacterium]
MEFRIADTFIDSLARLTNEEQKVVKTRTFDLQVNPASPGLQFHKIDKAKDPNFWSVYVNMDIRIIIHKTDSSLLICYVDHHDNAYRWAERRRLEIHPKTGAAQIVEVRETVKEIIIPKYVESEEPKQIKPLLFADVTEDYLLSCGVPLEWLKDIFNSNEDTILDLAGHLPREAAEAVLNIAIGIKPQLSQPVSCDLDPFDHPDAQCRFRIMNNVDELEQALTYPWEKWTIFLHPAQRELVEKEYNGPARVSGSAGTGKTIVALHRAVFLARKYPDARVLLVTFSDTLSNAIRTKLKRLISNEPSIAERLEVHSMSSIGRRLYEVNFGKPNIVSRERMREILKEAGSKVKENRFSMYFLLNEWEDIIDAWHITSWEAYKNFNRLGRKTRLPEKQRVIAWSVFDQAISFLTKHGLMTESGMYMQLSDRLKKIKNPPFDFLVIDEAQDISPPQLAFLAALGLGRPNSLFFAGDLGQRIFQQPFSWKALGVDIRGRSRTLRINYRTSHQIRVQADLLLGPELSDVDGNIEERKGTISVFNGPKPLIKVFSTQDDEIAAISEWVTEKRKDGLLPHELGVFVRSGAELDRSRLAIEQAGLPYIMLDENVETISNHVSISTMHLAKGLEFRAVVVMACDDEILPLQERIENTTDDSDLEEVYNTERHLLYVACTRARDHLLVT